MANIGEYDNVLLLRTEDLLPSVSVDSVVLGFHEGTLKILLSKFKNHNKWMLPGGFVMYDEDVDTAAYRILKDRTGLDKLYLRQFHLFGNYNRTNIEENHHMLKKNGVELSDKEKGHWFLQRFVSVGYYAFVEYSKVQIYAKSEEEVAWYHFDEIPELYSDHNLIIEKARNSIKSQLNTLPIGYELLPTKFTMTELRIIYETILGKKLDRRNFQRKMLLSGLVYKLDEMSKKWGVKSSALFSFNKEKYEEALESGLSQFD